MRNSLGYRVRRLLPPHPAVEGVLGRFASDSAVIRSWFGEIYLLWARWVIVAVFVALAVLFPAQTQWLIVLLACALALGNVVAASLLHQGLNDRSLRRVRVLASIQEWGAAFGVSIAFRRELDSVSPYVLLLFLLPVSYRYGIRGLVAAIGSVCIIITLWFGLHVTLFDILTADTTRSLVIEWTVFLVVAAVLIGALIQADVSRTQWERERLITFRRERSGLSQREWEVLMLVAESKRTYEEIGYLLNISPETVKTHVRRIGEKMEARGRAEVVRRAQEQQLLPLDDTYTPRVDTD